MGSTKMSDCPPNSDSIAPSLRRAPIVVSELDSEEERDDLEELNDFTSLLMPAARRSAARRLGTLNRRVSSGRVEKRPPFNPF